jgi:hypothetical protein
LNLALLLTRCFEYKQDSRLGPNIVVPQPFCLMKYLLASNDNKEYGSDEVSLVCEVACNFTINSKNTEVLAGIIEYVRSLPNDTNFMTELGERFVELVHKHVEDFQNEDG